MTSPNIMVLDIETAPLLTSTFSLWPTSIPLHALIRDWWMVSASWKFIGKKQVYYTSVLDDAKRFEKEYWDDYHVVKTIHDVLSQGDVDVLVGHNIRKFDFRKLMDRIAYHRLSPLPPIKLEDTYLMGKKSFALTSNKLEFALEHFKLPNKKMPLDNNQWSRIALGDRTAIKRNAPYNKQDVLGTEDYYLFLRAYGSGTVNHSHYISDAEAAKGGLKCKHCGAKEHKLKRRGYALTCQGKFARYQCDSCQGWSQGKYNYHSKQNTGTTIASRGTK